MVSGLYDIVNKTLGKGHYGVVKLGRHCLTGESVAIKIIEKCRLNKDSLNQLGNEIKILFRLSEYEHPNILKLYQTIDAKGKLFLITEYCGPHASDLLDYLLKKRGRNGLMEIEAKIFFIQICSAISYCHSMGIVHRDLKPENILVTDYKYTQKSTPKINLDLQHQNQPGQSTNLSGYPLLKLIDFGFANQWYPDEKMRTSCGTLAYSAPELLLGEPYDGTKVDVWGLGLMLYILIYNGNPFMQINDNETLTRILDCSFATPKKSNFDSDVIELLRSLIKRDPNTRLTIDAIFKHKWLADVVKPFEMTVKYLGPIKHVKAPQSSSELCHNLRSQYNRTRSLSITRMQNMPTSNKVKPLPQTRSSINLGRITPGGTTSPIQNLTTRSSIYRPTSPDVTGTMPMSEEETKIHLLVIQEMFELTKMLGSQSSIETSLKNSRLSHRNFNPLHDSDIAEADSSSENLSGLAKILESSKARSSGSPVASSNQDQSHINVINSKLSNDDYVYATYQLTRDRILRQSYRAIEQSLCESLVTLLDRVSFNGNNKQSMTSLVEPSAMALSLPLARKCSLVNEESAGSTSDELQQEAHL